MGGGAEMRELSSPLFYLHTGLDVLNNGDVHAGRTGPPVQAAPASREGRNRSRNPQSTRAQLVGCSIDSTQFNAWTWSKFFFSCWFSSPILPEVLTSSKAVRYLG